MNGKGDRARRVNLKPYEENYDFVFGKKEEDYSGEKKKPMDEVILCDHCRRPLNTTGLHVVIRELGTTYHLECFYSIYEDPELKKRQC